MRYLLLIAVFPSFVFADVFHCDGKYTNKPCQGESKLVEGHVSKVSRVPSDVPSIPSEQRASLAPPERHDFLKPEPTISTHAEHIDPRKIKLRNVVRGYGKVKAVGFLYTRDHDAERWVKKEIVKRTFNFPETGGQKQFDLELRLPQHVAQHYWTLIVE